MGGGDEPSNIVELSIEEHAAAHQYLYEKFGKIEDKLAWHGLQGIIPKKQIIEEISKLPKSEDHKRKISESLKGQKNFWLYGNSYAKKLSGKPKSELHKNKISNALKGRKREPFTESWKEALKEAKRNQPFVTCPHCDLYGKGPNMKRYHFDNCKEK
jgi:hypothetical protein